MNKKKGLIMAITGIIALGAMVIGSQIEKYKMAEKLFDAQSELRIYKEGGQINA